jgi:ABC-type Mn2+/Zn2+ transport system ATPase subunit
MITRVEIRNFKKIGDVIFNLDNTVVLIGPNNSGKTTILQALMLWKCGLDKIKEQQSKQNSKSKRIGVPINRKDLIALPVSTSRFIWKNQVVRASKKDIKGTENVRIEIIVDGESDGIVWSAPLEFDYTNSETIYCRPLRKDDNNNFLPIDEKAFETNISFLQPMSGISTIEDRLSLGSINSRIGEGKTADVLRNICYQLLNPETPTETDSNKNWEYLNSSLQNKFGVTVNKPIFNPTSGKIEMTYSENGNILDIASSGRGFQQTLLLLSFVLSYKNNILLLDEPDAHLEVIRQREIYELLKKFTLENKSQLIIASHSEIVLNEASEHDKVIAIYDNKVDEINELKDRTQFKKLLTDIGWDKYYLAKTKNHILYLEGVSDFRMLKAFAEKLGRLELLNLLDRANIYYTQNNVPNTAKSNFHSLRTFLPDLNGLAIFDKLPNQIKDNHESLKILEWKRRELENYFCFPDVLQRWAKNEGQIDLFQNFGDLIRETISENTTPANLKTLDNDWWKNTKMSEDYLPIIFKSFYEKQGKPNKFNKGNFYELIKFIEIVEIEKEVNEKLDSIESLLKKSMPS